MDFEPRITSDGYGWRCNFHLGYGHDAILEDAINEDSCVQVLRCLIAKADAEIHELENELAILQCQLKCAESGKHDGSYEACCTTFKRKIDDMTRALNNMKKERMSNEHDMDTTLKIRRPAESIHDIINTSTKQNFPVPERQVEGSSNEMNSPVNLGLVDIAIDIKQKEGMVESSIESRELTTEFERQCKPVDTVSEESCSDVAKYAIKDSSEAIILDKTKVEVSKKMEVDDFEHTLEGTNISTTCSQAYNNEGNSKLCALRHEETEDGWTVSKNSGSGSSPLYAKMNMIVKVEVEDSNISLEDMDIDSFCLTQDHESKIPIEDQQEVMENQSLGTVDIGMTFFRNREISNDPIESNSMKRKPQGKTEKRHFSSNGNNLIRSNSPSSEVDVIVCTPPELIMQRILVDTAPSEEVNVSEEDDLFDFGDNFASMPHNELVVCLEAPLSEKGKVSSLHSNGANPCKVSSRKTMMDIVATKESPAYDLESLRVKFSRQPDFLHKMKIPELKLIAKANKMKGFSKLKKERMIEEVINLLNAK